MDDDLSLTPDGKKRNPFSFLPFGGGKRVCFGKTVAQLTSKFFATYMTQLFDFEFVEKDLYKDKYPCVVATNHKFAPIMVRFSKRTIQ